MCQRLDHPQLDFFVQVRQDEVETDTAIVPEKQFRSMHTVRMFKTDHSVVALVLQLTQAVMACSKTGSMDRRLCEIGARSRGISLISTRPQSTGITATQSTKVPEYN